MRPHVKIRKDYVKLVRQGKRKEAQKILEKIWGREISNDSKKDISSNIDESDIDSKSSYNTLDDLSNINGIGKKTVKDIRRMFKDMDSLKTALKNDTVGLRDDIVDKLLEEVLNDC